MDPAPWARAARPAAAVLRELMRLRSERPPSLTMSSMRRVRSSTSASGLFSRCMPNATFSATVHVGKECVLLKDGVHRPPVGRQPLDLLAVEKDRARGHVLQPRDHAQQRGLAAARGTKEGEELVVLDRKARFLDRGDRPIALHYAAKLDRRRAGRGFVRACFPLVLSISHFRTGRD